MDYHRRVLRDGLAATLLHFFTRDAYKPSRTMRLAPEFQSWPERTVQARAQTLRRAGLLVMRGARSGTCYKLTEEGKVHLQTLESVR